MDEVTGEPGREHRFRRVYVDLYADVLRFVQRRTDDAAAAEDVVAEVFLAVWRRFEDVPAGHDAARAWVFGIARNLLLNSRRGERRRRALGVRLADAGRDHPSDAEPDEVLFRVDLELAWRRLTAVHQEALALSAFEGLDSQEAAAVVGITATAFRLRLSRGRKALRTALGAERALPATDRNLPDQKRPDQNVSERR